MNVHCTTVRSTDKHVLYDKQALSHTDKQKEPRILMIDDLGFWRGFRKKQLCLPRSLEKKHWPIWTTYCVDCWCQCHLLLSLWADSVYGVQSESEVSSQSYSLYCWLEHSQCCLTHSYPLCESLLISSVSLPLFQSSLTIMIPYPHSFSLTFHQFCNLFTGYKRH